MKTKHTKGEWVNNNGNIHCGNELVAFAATLMSRVDDSKMIGESWIDARERTRTDRRNCEKEAEANAKLIAAAPELLESLIELTDALKCEFGRDLTYLKAISAIKKATE